MTLKLFVLAIIFVLTSGALFSEFFKKHKFITFLASIMAIISSFFLLQDIMSSIKKDVIAEVQNNYQVNPLQAKLDKERQENAALQAKLKALQNIPKPVIPKPVSNKFTAGKVFRDSLADGSSGPEMVWIPSGSFRMGDIQGGGSSDEKPVHRVSVGKFAMGKFEVTFAEYDKFAEATGRKKPDDRGWGRGNRPVINVSWNDATAYTKWLSNQTGKTYRLPTEAEWEYAARAGTETKYWWGNDIGKNRAACDGCGAKWGWDAKRMTAPVGSFEANQFGLYDTAGNLWEWTCSEYTSKYNDKEKQCVTTGNRLSLRGGSWYGNAWSVRSANRSRDTPTIRNDDVGFRVSRLVTL